MSASALPLVLLGAGGHARVLLSLARATDLQVLGVCDPQLAAEGVRRWEGLDVLGDDSALTQLPPDRVVLMLGIGQLTAGSLRERVFRSWREHGYVFPSVVHPAAWVAPCAVLGAGVQVMAGAIVQPGCAIGENSVINTGARVDHDCQIGSNVHVAPGATLCGGVTIGPGAFIGAGATLIQGLNVGERAVVGAGVTLVRSLAPAATMIGAPNRLR